MEIKVQRVEKNSECSIGKMYINNVYVCDTLEDPDRGLKDSMSETEIKSKKIYGNTAIPSGQYSINMNTVSPSFKDRSWAKPYGGKLPRLQNVKGYEGVLIHVGNTSKDTLGCILVGTKSSNSSISNSTVAFNKLMTELLKAKTKGESIIITIE